MGTSAAIGLRAPVKIRRCARLVAGLILAGFLAGCQTVAETGRSQLILLPASADADLGLAAYQEIKATNRVSGDPELNRRVTEVGRRIATVSPDPGYDWEFTVFEADEPNAFALPGGKVGVNTGLFKVARNDDQLAAVMAHEVGHAIARHGAERMSHGLLFQFGLVALGAAVEEPSVVQLAAAAATLGVILPFSREQEAEADHLGLIYMAKAGYDPREAIELWRNFESLGGGRPPEFLATHPSPGSRIGRLQALMPEAMAIYEANAGRSQY
jgi:metalloendopeptidase OMA1, mitochondrial